MHVSPTNRLILEWLDFASGYLRSGSWLNIVASPAALIAALQAASNANLLYATAGNPVVGTVTPADSLYPSVQDIAQLVFITTALTQVPLVIPAPLASAFGAGGQTVDPSDPNIAAVIAAATGVLADQSGNIVTAFVSGAKSSRLREQQ
jgi:hypothetical protein